MMPFLAGFVRNVDRLNDTIGRGVAWLTLATVLVTFAVVVLRYVFSLGWVWMQESYVWLHGAVFMVGAAYTLLHNGHVRVDIFYRPKSRRYKALADFWGALFLLLPVVTMISIGSLDYVSKSWMILEESREAGGLPGLFILKTVIWVFCVLMTLQGLSMMARSVLVLRDRSDLIDSPAEEESQTV